MTESSKSPPIPESLRDEIAAHARAADLERVWQLLEVAAVSKNGDSAGVALSADALWGRIAVSAGIDVAPPAPVRTLTRVPDSGRTSSSPATAGHPGRRSWLRPALLAVAATVAVIAWWGTGTVRVATPPGQLQTVLLRDGSTVAMNGDSELRYPRFFRPTWLGGDGRRSVRVRGEAYFRVAKGSVPFVVQTAHAEIRVVGTRFNVKARGVNASARTDVAVEEGVVQVRVLRAPDERSVADARSAPDRAVVLRVNDRVSVRAESGSAPALRDEAVLRVTQGDPRRDLAWTNGGFAAVEQPLRDVLVSLEAQFGVELSMRDSAAASSSITLYYPERTTIDRILNDLATARGWTIRRTSRGYELRVAK